MHKHRVPPDPPVWWPEDAPWPPYRKSYMSSPSWWPVDEPWPPYHRHHNKRWRTVRRHLRYRVGSIFLVLFICTAILLYLLAKSISNHAVPDGMQEIVTVTPLVFRIITWVLFSGVIFGLVYIGSMIRKAAIPIDQILDAAGKIAEGDYSVRIPSRGPREMEALTHAFNDMSARLELNEKQRRALLADISHELRTPLTVIQGNLEGMLDGIYPADERTLQAVLDETHTMARIIEDLRTLTIVESGSLKLQMECVNPREFLEEIIPTYQALAESKGVNLHIQVGDDLPDIALDTTRIREVLANLITNALRYCRPEGRITLRCEQVGEHFVQFSVQDDGKGIESQDLQHIFERFYKDRDSGGSGLGLPIAKSLVEAHGGEIFAESSPGKGTTIRFTLPIQQD